MLPDCPVDIVERELRQFRFQVLVVVWNAVPEAVDGIAEFGGFVLGKNVDVFGEEQPRALEVLLGHAVFDQFVQFKKSQTECIGCGIRLHRANPDLENLLLTRQVRFRLEEEHAAGEVLDIGVVAVVKSADFTHPVVQIIVGAVLPEPGLHYEQSGKIRVAAFHVDGKSEGPCH